MVAREPVGNWSCFLHSFTCRVLAALKGQDREDLIDSSRIPLGQRRKLVGVGAGSSFSKMFVCLRRTFQT